MNHSSFTGNTNLDEQQRAAAADCSGSSLLLAVPGSGKTTTLLARLENLLRSGVPDTSVLVITFTNNAAEEMKERFRRQYGSNRVDFMTINSFCYRVVCFYADKTGRQKPEDLTDTGLLLRRILVSVAGDSFPGESDIREFAQKITYIKNMQLSAGEMEKLRIGDYPAKPLYDAYVRSMKAQNAMDYDDQLVYACKFLEKVPGVRNHYRRKYPYVMVDEAQDTSWLQHRILQILTQDGGNLFMVGDEDQSIYGFRAAYPEALLDFPRHYPGGKVHRLETNYRSGKDIVALADRFIRHNRKRYDKNMKPAAESSGRVRVESVARRSDQYRQIADWIREDPERETAVLYRNNDSAIPLMYHLRNAGISFRNRGLDTLFFSSRVVRDVKDILGFVMHPADSELFWRIYYKLNYRIPKKAVGDAVRRMDFRREDPILAALTESPLMGRQKKEDLQMLRDNLRDMRCRNNAKEALEMIRSGIRYRNEKSEKLFVLEALAEPTDTIADFLQKLWEMEQMISAGTESAASADAKVILSTIHGSKGMEYDRVILVDAVRDVLPSSENDREEERRIFYVAITRAREELILPDYGDCTSPFLRECFGKLPDRSGKQKDVRRMDSKEFREKAAEFVPGAEVRSRNFGVGTIRSSEGDFLEVYFPKDGKTRKFVKSICIEKGSLEIVTPSSLPVRSPVQPAGKCSAESAHSPQFPGR